MTVTTTNQSVETTLQQYIDETVFEKRELEAKIAEAQEALAKTQADLVALRTALSIHFEKQGIKRDGANLAEELYPLTQAQALIYLAEHRGGRIRTTEAQQILLSVGKISQPKNSYSIVQHLLERSDQFERVAPGTYQLVASQNGSHSALPPVQN